MRFINKKRTISILKLACGVLVCFFALLLVAMNSAQAYEHVPGATVCYSCHCPTTPNMDCNNSDCHGPGATENCMWCHNGTVSSAPDVSLFNTSGHGRFGIGCIDCHDSNIPHDGVERTYSFDSSQYGPLLSGVAYAAGYRLKYVNGEVPLMIPGNYNITFSYNAQTMKANAFRLCFDCHDTSKIFDDTPGDGIDSYFKASLPNPPRNYSYAWGSGADINEHVSHIMNYIGPFSDSDWDIGTDGPGGTDGRDTLTTCIICHNVHGAAGTHGSTNEPMIRDGSLIGRTGYGFSYVVEDFYAGGYPMVTSNSATQSTSVGAIFRNNTADMCGGSMCHDFPAPPSASSYDASGSSWGTYVEYYRPGPLPSNQPPVAKAGIDQTVHPGNLITLDGTASTDPDGNYPLSYTWQIISKPAGSTASLSNPDTVNSTFTPDFMGDYAIQLTVTDSLGLPSVPDEVLVSTYNTAPIADAGEDQAIIETGSTVQLDGTESWDDDGDTIMYAWTMITKPAASITTLSDSSSPAPTFVADVHGDYLLNLVVSDLWVSSDPDAVIVTFDNVKPVADAGNNQSVVQGDIVDLDGSGSSDANLDPLAYSWNIVSKPVGSLSEIEDPTAEQAQLITDIPGEYIVSLIVSDGFIPSDPDNITVVAVSYQDATTETLLDTTNSINTLDDSLFNNSNNKNALTNKINAALAQIDKGNYQNALNKLQNDILGKTDGCANTGAPEPNDWIEDCESQDEVYQMVMEAINLLQELI